MTRFAPRSASLRTIALGFLLTLHAMPTAAIDTGRRTPPKDVLDCTDRTNNICAECGQPEAEIACCWSDCDVVIGPQLPPPAPAPSSTSPTIRYGLGSMTYFSSVNVR